MHDLGGIGVEKVSCVVCGGGGEEDGESRLG